MSNTSLCLIPHTTASIEEFIHCYKFFFKKNVSVALIEIILIIGTVLANLTVGLLIYKHSKRKLTCFDQILIGHAIVEGLTGLIDVPFFHIFNIFDYWALGPSLSLFWTCFDNSINTITTFNMLYISWVRMRSMQSPTNFRKELLIKKPWLTMLFIWIFGFSGN